MRTDQRDAAIARAQGYVDGENCRRRNEKPPISAIVGIDVYCLGFRAGFFLRQESASREPPNAPAT